VRAAAPAPVVVHLALLSCTKLKHEGRHQAAHLYARSAQFRKALALAKARGADAIWILSAKHGAMPGDREVDYYQQELPTDCAALRAWGEGASRTLAAAYQGRAVRVTLLAGAKYVRYLCLSEAWRVDEPLRGVRGPGRRMALLDALTAAARAAPCEERPAPSARAAAQLGLFPFPDQRERTP
jgi:hypothetical protein